MIIDNLITLSESVSKYCVGMEGNVSGKTNNNSFFIKKSGAKLNSISYNGFIECSLNDNSVIGTNGRPSMEVGFHRYLLHFNDINYVSHTHPINTLKILTSKDNHFITKFSNHRIFPDQVIFNNKKSCLVPYAKPGHELNLAIEKSLNIFLDTNGFLPNLFLLQNHGIITIGKTIDECIIASDICEKAAEIYNENTNFLSNKQVDELLKDESEKYRKNLLK